jgi:hypothetical protein
MALGSGSARGWAHIGVLSALARHGIAPDVIAGCSMGAMVGAAFAAGRIEQLETWALSLDWKRVVGLLDLGLRGGLLKGDRLLNMFQEHFVECEFFRRHAPRDRSNSHRPVARASAGGDGMRGLQFFTGFPRRGALGARKAGRPRARGTPGTGARSHPWPGGACGLR